MMQARHQIQLIGFVLVGQYKHVYIRCREVKQANIIEKPKEHDRMEQVIFLKHLISVCY